MKPSEIYRRAIRVFGPQHQMRKAQEECAEFLVTTMHYEQGRAPLDAVIDELADVLVMAEQARLILGADLVDAAKQRKLDRLLNTLVECAQRERAI